MVHTFIFSTAVGRVNNNVAEQFSKTIHDFEEVNSVTEIERDVFMCPYNDRMFFSVTCTFEKK